MPNSQKGFGLLPALLVFLLVGFIAGVGWYVWQNQSRSNGATSIQNQTNIWTGSGGDLKFSNGQNWTRGVPVSGQDIDIDISRVKQDANGGQFVFTNDLEDIEFGKVTLSGSVPSAIFDIRGNPMRISGGIENRITKTDPSTAIVQPGFQLDVIFTESQTVEISTDYSQLSFGFLDEYDFNIGSNQISLTTDKESSFSVGSKIVGTGEILASSKPASESSFIDFGNTASKDFRGKLTIKKGLTMLYHPQGAGTSDIRVDVGASLGLIAYGSNSKTINVSNDITLAGKGVRWIEDATFGTHSGAVYVCLTVNEAGCDYGIEVKFTGQITLTGDAELGVSPSQEVFPGTTITYTFTEPVAGDYQLTAVQGSKAEINQ